MSDHEETAKQIYEQIQVDGLIRSEAYVVRIIAAALDEANATWRLTYEQNNKVAGERYGLALDKIAQLKARIVEQDEQIDRADEHTAKLMTSLEETERERDKMRERWQKMSDLAEHNLDEREKLLAAMHEF